MLWIVFGAVTLLVSVANAIQVVQCLPPRDEIARLIVEGGV